MAKKRHLKGIDVDEMAYIDEKFKAPSLSEGCEYVDDFKNNLKALGFKLEVKCKSEKQKVFWNNLKDLSKKINICDAPAGVGKSFLALAAGLYHLKGGNVSKMVVIVPTVEASETTKIGLLPGTINDKIAPYKMATISTIEKILKLSGNMAYHDICKILIHSGIIEFELLSYARGRNFDDCFLILDEAENLTKKECLLLMTRLGEGNAKIALIGDKEQCDRKDMKDFNKCGLVYAADKLKDLEEVTVDEFTNEDIVRNPFLTKLLNAWKGIDVETE